VIPPPPTLDELRRSCWIVVLAWNGWSDTRQCLASLAPITARGTHVLLVDNGSSDGTPREVRRSFPWVELLENGTNLGFPGGNNAGIRTAIARRAERIVLLNNDTTVDPAFLDELLLVSVAHPRAGFVCSKIYFMDQPDTLWFAGARLGRFTGHTPIAGFGQIDRGQYDHVESLDLFCACSVLVTKATLEEAGLMDEQLFLYCEEVDWMLRARKAGLTVAFAPRSRVWHRGMTSTGGARTGTHLYYYTRNILFVMNRELPIRFGLLRLARNVAMIGVLVASVFSQRLDLRTAVRGLCQGIRDYRAGRMGSRP
jgi:GT2 family glycosyltransferase